MLQAGNLLVQFPVKLLDFSIDIILLATLRPWVDSASNRNEYQESSWSSWRIRLTLSLLSVSQLFRKCGNPDISQLCGPPQPLRGIDLSLPYLLAAVSIFDVIKFCCTFILLLKHPVLPVEVTLNRNYPR
jgi:hypothetical protein